MNGPVDVLAVLDETALVAGFDNGWNSLDEADYQEARTAVVDLIATQRETLRMLEAAYRQLGMWTDDNKRIQRAKAALANMGDAK